MMINTLIRALIVIFVLMVLLVGFFTMFPEVKENISDVVKDILGLSFAKTDEQIRESVKLMVDSIEFCSKLEGNNCKCDIELDILPGDNKVVIDNGGEGSKFILVEEHGKVDATWNLDGRKIGFLDIVLRESSLFAYCFFEDNVLVYDSGWKRRILTRDNEPVDVSIVSSDGVSQYPVIKLEGGNFCFIDDYYKKYEMDVNVVNRVGGVKLDMSNSVLIGEIPIIERTILSDYYSVEEFFNNLGKCAAIGIK